MSRGEPRSRSGIPLPLIKICHERFIELHAWINPYRAVADISSYVAPGHPSKQHPEWFVRYGKQLLFNPGLPEVRAYTCKVVRDLVTRYDLDGIHMDDYFYPYPIAGEAFDDEAVKPLPPRMTGEGTTSPS